MNHLFRIHRYEGLLAARTNIPIEIKGKELVQPSFAEAPIFNHAHLLNFTGWQHAVAPYGSTGVCLPCTAGILNKLRRKLLEKSEFFFFTLRPTSRIKHSQQNITRALQLPPVAHTCKLYGHFPSVNDKIFVHFSTSVYKQYNSVHQDLLHRTLNVASSPLPQLLTRSQGLRAPPQSELIARVSHDSTFGLSLPLETKRLTIYTYP